MKIKTSELTGPALDWAVATCVDDHYVWWSKEGRPFERTREEIDPRFEPSINWSQGGPIIEREWLQVTPWPNEHEENMRWHCVQHDAPVQCHAYGPTPLIAAMRCFVASKLGDEVEIPEELCPA